MNRDRILDIPRVAAGKGHHHGNVSGTSHTEDELVALLQSVHGERQAAELVVAIGIGSGNVAE